MIHQFFIVNKSGSMIYNYETENKTDINTLLVLTSTLHSINYISTQIKDDLKNEFINLNEDILFLKFKKRTISIFQTITGTSFICVGDKKVDKDMFTELYRYYCDYVLKNPFYSLENIINCSKFQPINILKKY